MIKTLLLVCALALAGCSPQQPDPPRYTVAATADQFLVLDQVTGDAWISAGMYWFHTNLPAVHATATRNTQ